MTEAAAGGGRAEMERRLVQRSLEDDSFRQRLLEDPKGTVEQELGRGRSGKGGRGDGGDHLPGASQRVCAR
jgi:hypothetical protein